MTRRRDDLPLQKTTLNLFAGDFDRLQTVYPRLGAGKVIRDLVHAHLRRIDENTAKHVPAMKEAEDDLEELLNERDFGAV